MRPLRLLCGLGWLVLAALRAHATEAVWQWSVPLGEGRAFLWIPEDCRQVRAVVVAQHNMIEQGILEHATMRRALADLGIAEVFIAPPFDRPFAFDRGAGERLEAGLRALGEESGYAELASVPLVPLGHSACASFPWNLAAWKPARTLAILSVKGDAPQTDLTGSGAPNPDWGPRSIDGIPGLLVMSEQEWWEARLAPLLKFRAVHPATPLAVLADTGQGHFDATDRLVEFLALFIRKAAATRLPANGTGALRAIDPAQGWLVDRWRADGPPRAEAAPASGYRGDRAEAFWCFDEEMARATEAVHAASRAKKAQQVEFMQDGMFAPITTAHTGVELKFQPEADGLTFRLTAGFIAPLPPKAPVAAKDQAPPPTTVQPVAAMAGSHASGPVTVAIITGPVVQTGADTFRVHFNRTASTIDKRERDIWLLARHPGDHDYKGAVQQALLRLPRFTTGVPQVITFPTPADQPVGTKQVVLAAVSTAGTPVGYYVREGPAFERDGVLRLTPVPPRARWPVKVTVVAWQFGREADPMIRSAPPVERTFLLTAP